MANNRRKGSMQKVNFNFIIKESFAMGLIFNLYKGIYKPTTLLILWHF